MSDVIQEGSDEWLKDRRKYIGASDVAAILGLNPWSTEWEVAEEKRGNLLPSKSLASEAGHALEPVVINYAESKLGSLERKVRVVHPSLPLAASCDALTVDGRRPVEAKTSGIWGPVIGDWGAENTDEVPDYYLVQVHAQLLVTGADLAYLYALLPGRGFVGYQIERNERLYEGLSTRLAEWWDRHIIKGEPVVLDKPPSLDVVRRMKREPNKIITASDAMEELIAQRASLKAIIKEASDKLEKDIEPKLLLELGDAEGASLKNGGKFLYLERTRRGYTVAETKYRQMEIKRGK